MLNGKNIILRHPKQEDLISFNKWRNYLEIKKQALLHPFPITMEQELDWFQHISHDKSNRNIFFSIVSIDEKLIGYTQLSELDWINKNCFFGIIIGEKENHGKGYGSEALNLLIDYAFNNLNLHKVTLKVVDYNKQAIKLYEKKGFVKEGILKENILQNNEYSDVSIYSIFNKNR